MQEFFEHIERERVKDFEILARKYHAIGPLLTKMEGLVVHTNTGKSPKLHQYYSYWEKKVYQSLSKVHMPALTFFQCVCVVCLSVRMYVGGLMSVCMVTDIHKD